MAPPSRPRAPGLALAALCLLALAPDAGAGPLLVGGLQDLPPDAPEVQRATQVAVATFNEGSNSLFYFRPSRVLKAQSQVVAGILYYLSMEMESTTCRKNATPGDHGNLSACPLTVGAQQEKLHCDFEVLTVPWRDTTELLKQRCTSV
ncbi:cystatin-M [Dasypus novemcinctus]|uniref:cystatin-M n=1 Tax=Dasypus novemcinctus TaxID=9361 RepID=UPI00265FCC18|nr:cystatin-M [Dasypus novemcinctus]